MHYPVGYMNGGVSADTGLSYFSAALSKLLFNIGFFVPSLFDPLKLGHTTLKNRVLMELMHTGLEDRKVSICTETLPGLCTES